MSAFIDDGGHLSCHTTVNKLKKKYFKIEKPSGKRKFVIILYLQTISFHHPVQDYGLIWHSSHPHSPTPVVLNPGGLSELQVEL